jgi:NhaC family Na+:H+ antiporter
VESTLITIWLVLVALAFDGVIDKIGVSDLILRTILKAARTTCRLVLSPVTSAIGTNSLDSDQYIGIVLSGRLFQSPFRRMGLTPETLSLAVGDSAIVSTHSSWP